MSQTPSAKILIVTGAPCAGKTTVAGRLARGLGAPLFTKDAIKERLFDAVGWGTPDLSRRLDEAAYSVLFHLAECEAAAGRTFVIESNFKPAKHSAPLRRMLDDNGAQAMQVVCSCSVEVLRDRFRLRAERSDRHPGHCDAQLAQELPEVLARGGYGFLDIPGERLELDTTDLDSVDYPALLREARAFALRPSPHCPEGRGGG